MMFWTDKLTCATIFNRRTNKKIIRPSMKQKKNSKKKEGKISHIFKKIIANIYIQIAQIRKILHIGRKTLLTPYLSV